VLVDTVWLPFAEEFVENLASEIDLTKLISLWQIMVKWSTVVLYRP
jgi:hypothetical protein